MNLHRLPEAKADMEQALELFESEADAAEVAVMQGNLGTLASDEHEYDKARRYLEQSLTFYRLHPNNKRLASILFNLGTVQMRAEQWEEAKTTLAESLIYSRKISDGLTELYVLHNLGLIALECQRPSEAIPLLCQALELRVKIEGDAGLGMVKNLLYLLFAVYATTGFSDSLIRCVGKIEAIQTQQNVPIASLDEARYNILCKTLQSEAHNSYTPLFEDGAQSSVSNLIDSIKKICMK